jgi:predicted anti-sigma-YlaC factor YlaD
MTCREAIALLADYLDRDLTPEHIARIERHLAICAPCRAYFATYDRTRELAARVQELEIPVGMKERLLRLLLDAASEA